MALVDNLIGDNGDRKAAGISEKFTAYLRLNGADFMYKRSEKTGVRKSISGLEDR